MNQQFWVTLSGKKKVNSEPFTQVTSSSAEKIFFVQSTCLGKTAKWLDWKEGQPNNWGGREHCVYSMKVNKSMDDCPCGSEKSVVCTAPVFSKFSLRGVCSESPIDSFYDLKSGDTLVGEEP